MRYILRLTIILFFAILSCAVYAETETYRLKVGDFTELTVVDNINVIYKSNSDSAGYVVFSANKDVVEAVLFTTGKNKLRIERNLNTPFVEEHFPVVTVYSTSISNVENFGDSTLTVLSPTPTSEVFKARVEGNGTISIANLNSPKTNATLGTGKGTLNLEGQSENISLRNVGTGIINAIDLKAQEGSVYTVGTGTTECFITDKLTVTGMGSGKIYVKGNPLVKKRAIGKIRIFNVQE